MGYAKLSAVRVCECGNMCNCKRSEYAVGEICEAAGGASVCRWSCVTLSVGRVCERRTLRRLCRHAHATGEICDAFGGLSMWPVSVGEAVGGTRMRPAKPGNR